MPPHASAIDPPAPATRDPLTGLFARGRINRAQYLAGQEFLRQFEIAEKDAAASRWLAKAYGELGQDGAALAQDMLVHGLTARQVAESRGLTGPTWLRYFSRRFSETLDCLAVVYGFASGERKPALLAPERKTLARSNKTRI